MHRHTRSDTGDMSSRSSRAPSFSSDRPSVSSSVTFQMPTTVRPPPAYIAASVASQTVTDHHNARLRNDDDDAAAASALLDNAVFAEPALALLNAFLDHLLFAFLATARSPALSAVRPAVADVLKPRLARDAIEAADEELQGLLTGDEDDDGNASGNGNASDSPAHHARVADRWDVEKVWKRTRLRIMVYTRLGELEDDDEDRYVQQERGLSMDDDDDDDTGLVSWASAIFLTSVIEYVAEQTLNVSGQAAFARMAARAKKLGQLHQHQHQHQHQLQLHGTETLHGTQTPDSIHTPDGIQTPDGTPTLHVERLVIEEPDVEKIALNAALGRLWRTWKKRVRSPTTPLSLARGMHLESSRSSLHRRQASDATADYSLRHQASFDSAHTPTETQIAANIPLPMGNNDVAEIEVPGLACSFDSADSTGSQTPVARPQRPMSAIMLAPAQDFRRKNKNGRPLSMPGPEASPFAVSAFAPAPGHVPTTAEGPETPFETPLTTMFDRDSYMGANEPDKAPQSSVGRDGQRESDSDSNADADMVAFAASTGMGLRMSTLDPIQTTHFHHSSEGLDTTPGGHESEPEIMHSKRMSVEKFVSPGLVRTYSTRSSLLRSPRETPMATPSASQYSEGRTYLDDSDSDQDTAASRAIGVAHTSNVPVRNTPTPDSSADKGKYAAHGGYVEVQPRHFSSSSTSARNTPTPDGQPLSSTRSLTRSRPSHEDQSTSTPPRDQVLTEPKSRVASLPALQEVESQTGQSNQNAASDSAQRRSPSFGNSMRNSSYHSFEAPKSVAERQMQRSSAESFVRSAASSLHKTPSQRSTTPRVVSSASTTQKHGSFSATHNSPDAEIQRSLSRALSGRMSAEDRERQFDSLVKGKETVKYTITPANMRDPESPVVQKMEPDMPSNSSIADSQTSTPRNSTFGTGGLPMRTASRNKGPTASNHKPSPSRKVVIRPLAREPRIESESMRDFADFIRSTGPSPGQEKDVQPFVNISGNGSKSAGTSSTLITRNASTRQSNRNADAPSPRMRVNMEPRSPAGLSNGNNDLIDFIRQGPPDDEHPRINRSIAPFRTTVDSDQFDSMLGTHGNVEAAYTSKASTLNSKHSTQTVNSRTGLLPTPNVVQPAYSNTPQMLTGSMSSSSEPHITKTRRRVKDPYAIDMSDEDDDEEIEDRLTALPHSNQPTQESLMDFLNDMDPPSTSKPQPFMLSEQTIAAAKARAASSSNSSLSSSATAIRNGAPAASTAPEANRAHQSRPQARAPVIVDTRIRNTATSDLADFLRNSGPPEMPAASARKEAPVEQEKKRRFWRSKKTYPDMP